LFSSFLSNPLSSFILLSTLFFTERRGHANLHLVGFEPRRLIVRMYQDGMTKVVRILRYSLV
jgi:hypothetical protein